MIDNNQRGVVSFYVCVIICLVAGFILGYGKGYIDCISNIKSHIHELLDLDLLDKLRR